MTSVFLKSQVTHLIRQTNVTAKPSLLDNCRGMPAWSNSVVVVGRAEGVRGGREERSTRRKGEGLKKGEFRTMLFLASSVDAMHSCGCVLG